MSEHVELPWSKIGRGVDVYFQPWNSETVDHIQMDLYQNFSFPMHIHRDLEFVFVFGGEIEIITDSGTEVACEGDLALILNNRKHSFCTRESSQSLIITFSPHYVKTFMQELDGRIGDRCVFPAGEGLKRYLEECYLRPERPDRMTCKATFYAICARYLQCVELKPMQEMHDELITKLMLYVEKHYHDNISLRSASMDLGYDENYLSRYFSQSVGIHFRRFINLYRIEEACHKLKDPQSNIADVALSVGFQNIRSFNRAFQDIMGQTPSAYMK